MNAMAIFSRITRRHAEKSTLCASLCLMPVTTTLDSYGNKAFRFADLASRGKPRQLAGQHPQVRRHDTGRTRRGDRTVHCDRVHARPSARRRRPAGDQKHRSQRSQSHSGDPCTASGLGVGLWIARRHLTLSIVDFSKSIIAEHTLPLPLGHKADTTLERAMLLINETLSSIDAEASELVGIGVAVAAPVATSDHTIAIPAFCRMGRRRYHVPVAHGVQRSRIRR